MEDAKKTQGRASVYFAISQKRAVRSLCSRELERAREVFLALSRESRRRKSPTLTQVTTHSAIARRYVSSAFLIDLLSTFPVDLIQKGGDVTGPCSGVRGRDEDDGGSSALLRSAKLLRVLRLAKLFKLTKLLKLNKQIKVQKIYGMRIKVQRDMACIYM